MRLILILFLIFLTRLVVNSQSDSTSIDKAREKYSIGHHSGNAELVEGAIKDCKNLITIYKKNNDRKTLAKTYTLLGQILVEKGKFKESKGYLIKALELSNKAFGADSSATLEAKKYLSWAYGYLGDLETELKYSLELLESYKKNESKNILVIADLYNTIGLNYGLRNNFEKEREYMYNSEAMLIKYKPKGNDENMQVQGLLMNVYNSMSLSFIGSIDYSNALIYGRRSLKISQKIAPNNPERAATMVAVGRCIYTLEKKCDSAIYYIDNALKLLELNLMDSTTIWVNYRCYKVDILARCGNSDKAKEVANSTIKIMLERGDSPEEALNKLLILSRSTHAELTTMENRFREKEEVINQKTIFYKWVIVSILVLTSTLFLYIRSRLKLKSQIALVKQRDEIRTRISEDLHDEIGAGLTRISMTCSDGERNLKKQVPLEIPFLDKVRLESRNLSKNLSELIWATKPENDNLISLIAEIRKYCHDFFEDSDIKCKLNISDDIESFPTRPESNWNVFLVLKESLNNIVKHSDASVVEIDFTVWANKDFKLSVTDNGKGFDPTLPTTRNGKAIMNKRATSVKNGRFEIKSEIGVGTTIITEGNLS
jgi:signal transduction histidine kinase